MIRLYIFVLLTIFSSPTICGTYQPDDIAAYQEPSRLVCSGLESYPKGIKIDIPQHSTHGDLEQGLQYLYPEGKVAVIVFEFYGKGGNKEIQFRATRIDLLNWRKSENSGACDVVRWYPAPKE